MSYICKANLNSQFYPTYINAMCDTPTPITNTLELASISSLGGKRFMIRDYQRGYRWTDTEVNLLLDDILEFTRRDKTEGEFYCLQPVVALRTADGTYDIIDGQQRLTTLFLILKYFEQHIKILFPAFKPFTLSYETRPGSEDFLANITDSGIDPDTYIDYHFMHRAYETITTWMKGIDDTTKLKLVQALLLSEPVVNEAGIETDKANNVRVIWYEVAPTEKATSVDIFTRINIGKIPLTNSELIKALLLRKSNFNDAEATLRQLRISTEWNAMDQRLQDDNFWHFIFSSTNPRHYDNRIEYIFDLMTGRGNKNDTEFYHTFNNFQSRLHDKGISPEALWLEIKRYFQTLDEWYEDRDLYHLIGFLIEYGEDIDRLREECAARDKDDFRNHVRGRIRSVMSGIEIENLEYRNGEQVRKTLVLFNILTVLQNIKSDMRFPFSRFKTEGWDIEHICSQTDRTVNGQPDRRAWCSDMLRYYTGTDNAIEAREYVFGDGREEEAETVSGILEFYDVNGNFIDKIPDDRFNALFTRIQQQLEGQPDNRDWIGNLTLLDAATNRSYGNAYFPVKRLRIIDNDRDGVFIPIATKNVFLKYYTRHSDRMLFWSQDDAEDYFDSIKDTLKDYLQNG